jgi:hypothetical protein
MRPLNQVSEIIQTIDLRKTRLRFLILFFSSFVSFGSYFVYDNPSALETQLQDVKIT